MDSRLRLKAMTSSSAPLHSENHVTIQHSFMLIGDRVGTGLDWSRDGSGRPTFSLSPPAAEMEAVVVDREVALGQLDAALGRDSAAGTAAAQAPPRLRHVLLTRPELLKSDSRPKLEARGLRFHLLSELEVCVR